MIGRAERFGQGDGAKEPPRDSTTTSQPTCAPERRIRVTFASGDSNRSESSTAESRCREPIGLSRCLQSCEHRATWWLNRVNLTACGFRSGRDRLAEVLPGFV